MPTEPVNPYAAPVHDESAAPAPARLWSVSSGVLQVQGVVHMPAVDLVEDAPRWDRLPSVRRFAASAPQASLISVISITVTVAIVLLIRNLVPSSDFRLPIFAGIVGGISIRLLAKKAGRPTLVKYYASRDWLIKTSRILSWARWTTLILSIAILGVMSYGQLRPLQNLGALLTILAILITLGIFARSRTRPLNGGSSGPWTHLSRVSPQAIQQLREIEKNPPPASPKMIRVYAAYPFRFPLRAMMSRYWFNPLVFLVFLLRRTVSRNVTMDILHESEATPIPVSEAPATLRALAEPWLSGAYGQTWEWTHLRCQEPLSGMSLTETLEFSTTDQCHAMTLHHVTQIAGGHAFRFRICHFVTHLQDGVIVRTSTRMPLTPVKGMENHWAIGPVRAWQKHLAALDNRPVQPASNQEEWETRRAAWAEAIHAAHFAGGFEGSVREVPSPFA